MASEAIYLPGERAIRFAIYPDGLDGPRILAHIREEALRHSADPIAGPADCMACFEADLDRIEALAIARYRAAPGEAIWLASPHELGPPARETIVLDPGIGVEPLSALVA